MADTVSAAARRRALPAILAGLGLLATACQAAPGGGSGGGGTEPATHSPSAAAFRLSIVPANGARNIRPDHGITVTASGGTISTVTVAGGQVTGSLNAARTVWHTRWALPIHTHLVVTATGAAKGGRPVTQTASFTTLDPANTFRMQIFEGYRQTYGVGMPILLNFDQPITNRKAVERALQLTTSKPVVGAWYWDGSTALIFRPRDYWPAGTTVSFTAHLDGVQGAPGVYGYHTLTQTFLIGRSLIVTASTATHHMRLYRDGKLFRVWPISTGKPGDNTPNGTYLTIEKGNPVIMKGPGYRISVPWSVRFTWSGDYLHDAYWSVGQQGFANVSHGCVNMPPADAEFYYKMAVPGDPVTISGSPRGGAWDNGWTHWFLSWPQLLAGSALHQAVLAGPGGSRFAGQAAVPPSTATAPIGTSQPGNSRPA
jgi:lipoprotein-anchoring transpeptidase ErfK/SrfK